MRHMKGNVYVKRPISHRGMYLSIEMRKHHSVNSLTLSKGRRSRWCLLQYRKYTIRDMVDWSVLQYRIYTNNRCIVMKMHPETESVGKCQWIVKKVFQNKFEEYFHYAIIDNLYSRPQFYKIYWFIVKKCLNLRLFGQKSPPCVFCSLSSEELKQNITQVDAVLFTVS
jgi:hypothetical protein